MLLLSAIPVKNSKWEDIENAVVVTLILLRFPRLLLLLKNEAGSDRMELQCYVNTLKDSGLKW